MPAINLAYCESCGLPMSDGGCVDGKMLCEPCALEANERACADKCRDQAMREDEYERRREESLK